LCSTPIGRGYLSINIRLQQDLAVELANLSRPYKLKQNFNLAHLYLVEAREKLIGVQKHGSNSATISALLKQMNEELAEFSNTPHLGSKHSHNKSIKN
jgi:hypothetical protein